MVSREIDRDALNTAEELRVTVHVEAPAGYAIDFGESEADFGEFAVIHRIETGPQLQSGGRRLAASVTWVLEPFLAGGYEVPAMIVRGENPASGDALSFELEAVPIEVRSLLPPETKNLDIRGLAPAESRGQGWWWGLVIVGVIGGFAYWYYRHGRALPVEEALAPGEEALRSLEDMNMDGDGRSIGDGLGRVYYRYVERANVGDGDLDDEARRVQARFEAGVDYLRFSSGNVGTSEGQALTKLMRRFLFLTGEVQRREGTR
ncbi:MAG: hypothetical protein AAF591_19645 [Verrucomicrobiota bacterium]